RKSSYSLTLRPISTIFIGGFYLSNKPLCIWIDPHFLIFVLFSACSCGNQVQHAEENVQQELALVVKDSIQINYAGMLHLQDIDPDKERLLLYDQQREFFFHYRSDWCGSLSG